MSTDTLPAVGPPAAGYRRALIGASVGNVVEWYDFALFAGSATVIAAVLTPGGWAGFTTVFAVFAMSCLFRPLGALMIGARADRIGRRSVLAATIVLMAGATVAIGLLPPWTAIGVAAPLCLLALRAVQAFSCGGEIGVSVAYLMEFSPAGRRGATAAGTSARSASASPRGSGRPPSSPRSSIRMPWNRGDGGCRSCSRCRLGLVGLYIRRRLAESPVFAGPAPPGRVAPLAVLREFGPTVRRCFVLACAYSAAFNVWFLFLPSYVTATGASSLAVALTCALTGLLVTAVTAPVFGRLSDRIGRRPVLLGATASLAVVAVPVYLWMLTGSTLALMLGSIVMGVIIGAFVIPAFFAEQFPARVRATGLGLAYGVGSAVVGGTAPVLATVLSRQASPAMVPGYLVIWAIFALIAVRRSPESHSAGAAT